MFRFEEGLGASLHARADTSVLYNSAETTSHGVEVPAFSVPSCKNIVLQFRHAQGSAMMLLHHADEIIVHSVHAKELSLCSPAACGLLIPAIFDPHTPLLLPFPIYSMTLEHF